MDYDPERQSFVVQLSEVGSLNAFHNSQAFEWRYQVKRLRRLSLLILNITLLVEIKAVKILIIFDNQPEPANHNICCFLQYQAMIINKKTIEKLRGIINEESEYRSGPKLVEFFNTLGSNDSYGQGFPSRWAYTDEKLAKINGTPELDKCIKAVFSPINFIGRYEILDKLIADFNAFLAFDNWQVIRKNTDITFQKGEKVTIPETPKIDVVTEDNFLNQEFKGISLDQLGLDGRLTEVINSRFDEIKSCLQNKAPLSVIFLAGSSLEGILLGIASEYPKAFNTAKTAPQKDGKVKMFYDWSLANLIDTAHELGILKEDVRKFSHALRDFRNYIHPLQQVGSGFHPDEHTARICWQVLKAAIHQLSANKKMLSTIS